MNRSSSFSTGRTEQAQRAFAPMHLDFGALQSADSKAHELAVQGPRLITDESQIRLQSG